MKKLYYAGKPVRAIHAQITCVEKQTYGYTLYFGSSMCCNRGPRKYYLPKKAGEPDPKKGEYITLYFSFNRIPVASYFRGKFWYRAKGLKEVKIKPSSLLFGFRLQKRGI